MSIIVDLCQMVPTKSYDIWYTINADHVTRVYLQAGLWITGSQYTPKANQVLQLHPNVAYVLCTDDSVIYPIYVKNWIFQTNSVVNSFFFISIDYYESIYVSAKFYQILL